MPTTPYTPLNLNNRMGPNSSAITPANSAAFQPWGSSSNSYVPTDRMGAIPTAYSGYYRTPNLPPQFGGMMPRTPPTGNPGTYGNPYPAPNRLPPMPNAWQWDNGQWYTRGQPGMRYGTGGQLVTGTNGQPLPRLGGREDAFGNDLPTQNTQWARSIPQSQALQALSQKADIRPGWLPQQYQVLKPSTSAFGPPQAISFRTPDGRYWAGSPVTGYYSQIGRAHV